MGTYVPPKTSILDKPPEIRTYNPNSPYNGLLEGRVQFENVSFQYGGPDSPKILEGISIDIPAGKCVAIVGRSGSGKTTLVKCLAGLQEPTEGVIRCNQV